eukprot:1543530-Amphidinium_carterae.1
MSGTLAEKQLWCDLFGESCLSRALSRSIPGHHLLNHDTKPVCYSPKQAAVWCELQNLRDKASNTSGHY